jgi:hypothetical protein
MLLQRFVATPLRRCRHWLRKELPVRILSNASIMARSLVSPVPGACATPDMLGLFVLASLNLLDTEATVPAALRLNAEARQAQVELAIAHATLYHAIGGARRAA